MFCVLIHFNNYNLLFLCKIQIPYCNPDKFLYDIFKSMFSNLSENNFQIGGDYVSINPE